MDSVDKIVKAAKLEGVCCNVVQPSSVAEKSIEWFLAWLECFAENTVLCSKNFRDFESDEIHNIAHFTSSMGKMASCLTESTAEKLEFV